MESPELLLIPTTFKSVIVCKDMLRKSQTLKKAPIFRELFKLDDKLTKWKVTDMMTDEKGNITLLNELNIHSHDWMTLIKFIKLNDESKKTLNELIKLDLFTEDEVDALYYTSIKLGGIPDVDIFYLKYHKNEKLLNKIIYNPQEPKDDYKNIYLWTMVNDTHSMTSEIRRLLDIGYACTSKTFREGVDQYWYMRKEKTATA
tara:strand:+ start:1261 stop:1866 length:606 start_codon:yes stop_codon:yes gene_type:complete